MEEKAFRPLPGDRRCGRRRRWGGLEELWSGIENQADGFRIAAVDAGNFYAFQQLDINVASRRANLLLRSRIAEPGACEENYSVQEIGKLPRASFLRALPFRNNSQPIILRFRCDADPLQ